MHRPIPPLTPEQTKRFWSHVKLGEPDECWPWTGRIVKGYGVFSVRHLNYRANRIVLFLTSGDPGELCALHYCDNPPCCNPGHLFKGTEVDNTQDRDRKLRGVRGTASGKAKLTDGAVIAIRKRYSEGESSFDLAKEYGIHHSTIWLIAKRKIWTHI